MSQETIIVENYNNNKKQLKKFFKKTGGDSSKVEAFALLYSIYGHRITREEINNWLK